MAGPIAADRVRQTTTTTGTGTLSLDAAIPTGARGFVAGVGDTNTCYYCIQHQTLDEWEVGIGTVTDAGTDTLSRTTVLSSSTGSAVNFSAGTKDVFVVAPSYWGTPLVMVPGSRAIRVWGETLNSSTIGNARGNGSVDLQLQRAANSQVASGGYSVIGGGYKNTASNAYATVGGGIINNASGNRSTIAGGAGNSAGGTKSTVGGGNSNSAGGAYATVCGGGSQNASAGYTFIGGGYANVTSGIDGVVCGGSRNTSSGSETFIGAGVRNTASGNYSAIVGGWWSVAAKFGQQAHAAGRFSNAGDAQTGQYVLRNQTANGTQTELFLNGSSARLTLADDTTYCFQALIVARRTDADNESAAYKVEGCIDRNSGAGSTALVGSITKVALAEDNAGWDVDVNADTSNGSLRVQVTGEAAKSVNWVAFIRTVETTG